MGDKRRPDITILLRYKGKAISNKVELFHQRQFTTGNKTRWTPKYRMRVSGAWFPKGQERFFYKYEIRDILWRSIKWN